MIQRIGTVYETPDGREFADRVEAATHELFEDLEAWKKDEGRDEISPFFFAQCLRDLREGDDVSRFCDPCAQSQLIKACNLLGEVLRKDREAIARMKSEAPWYQVPDELADLHRRIARTIGEESPNATPSATEGGR